jgi:hypothetical protein
LRKITVSRTVKCSSPPKRLGIFASPLNRYFSQITLTIKINTIKVLNSESIVIIWIKGEYLLYSKISGGMIGYGWGNVCYIVNFPPGEYVLYSNVSGGKVYYIANITRPLIRIITIDSEFSTLIVLILIVIYH